MRRDSVLTEQRTEPVTSARLDDRAASVRTLRVHGDLTLAVAPALCRAVADAVSDASECITIDLRGAKTADVVGLAALLQCGTAAERGGAEFSVVADGSLREAVLAARLLEEIRFATGISEPDGAVRTIEASRQPDTTPLLTRSPRIGLRQPTWDELALFGRWADDRCLDEMVGSELLYRCRHLGAYHPDFVRDVLTSPTALTLVIEPLATPGHPVGFVRLYDIQLSDGIAFLETVVTTGESLRKGWGVEASRLLLAYGLDVLGLQRVEAKAYSYNVLSANALRRNGFRREGVLRGAHRYQGQRWDILVYSILEEEMRAQRTPDRYPYVGFWAP
jgi:RimJ/RimL family protein N-acetyltransferase/ABC-type transporter Mla MlaB component